MKPDALKLLVAAGNPIISIATPDETRAVRFVRETAQQMGLPVAEWSLTDGLLAGQRASCWPIRAGRRRR